MDGHTPSSTRSTPTRGRGVSTPSPNRSTVTTNSGRTSSPSSQPVGGKSGKPAALRRRLLVGLSNRQRAASASPRRPRTAGGTPHRGCAGAAPRPVGAKTDLSSPFISPSLAPIGLPATDDVEDEDTRHAVGPGQMRRGPHGGGGYAATASAATRDAKRSYVGPQVYSSFRTSGRSPLPVAPRQMWTCGYFPPSKYQPLGPDPWTYNIQNNTRARSALITQAKRVPAHRTTTPGPGWYSTKGLDQPFTSYGGAAEGAETIPPSFKKGGTVSKKPRDLGPCKVGGEKGEVGQTLNGKVLRTGVPGPQQYTPNYDATMRKKVGGGITVPRSDRFHTSHTVAISAGGGSVISQSMSGSGAGRSKFSKSGVGGSTVDISTGGGGGGAQTGEDTAGAAAERTVWSTPGPGEYDVGWTTGTEAYGGHAMHTSDRGIKKSLPSYKCLEYEEKAPGPCTYQPSLDAKGNPYEAFTTAARPSTTEPFGIPPETV